MMAENNMIDYEFRLVKTLIEKFLLAQMAIDTNTLLFGFQQGPVTSGVRRFN